MKLVVPSSAHMQFYITYTMGFPFLTPVLKTLTALHVDLYQLLYRLVQRKKDQKSTIVQNTASYQLIVVVGLASDKVHHKSESYEYHHLINLCDYSVGS